MSLLGLVLLSAGLAGCQKALILDASFEMEEVKVLPLVLPAEDDSLYSGLKNRDAVLGFYQVTRYASAWTDHHQQPLSLGDSLIRFIRNIRYHGLLPQDYHLSELEGEPRPVWLPEVLMRRDVILTDAFLSLANDLEHGRLAVADPARDSLRVSLFITALQDGSLTRALKSRERVAPQYHYLKKALAKAIDNTDAMSRDLLLRGITVDSLASHRQVRKIEINLERWRKEKKEWGPRYIVVNIPSFMIRVVDDYRVVLESRSIVGKPDRATPVFSSVVQCFVTYPYWHVPRRISVEEFLPAIQRDTSFITRNNFDVLSRTGKVLNPDSIPWSTFHKNNFPVVLRQREGRENSLGVIKFVFDNPYAVFVHDTNAPRLFNSKKRAFSHGCIRMEKATALAHYLVTGHTDKTSPMVERYLHEKKMHTIDATKPIDIHIRYFTAEADVKGDVVFFDDIYEADQSLTDAFYGRAPIITKRMEP